MRLAKRAFSESAAPYARPILRFVSQRSGKSNFCFSANFAFFSIESNDAPRIAAFFLENSSARSRNPRPSAVQPGVSAAG